ncbi:MAG: AAA family ATPase [Deltaproteobacteria bacterium]|nr:AAA family ATPase [Deltaproteobacteria bacterium]
MLDGVTLRNVGPLEDVQWSKLGSVNLVIGENGTGKTFLLKSIYSALRTIEEYKRGDDQRTASEILADKLYWTFQPDKIGDLVTKDSDQSLRFSFSVDGKDFWYEFGRDTTRKISHLENHVPPRSSNSIFLPAKEVLSLHQNILKSRDQDKAFGFDDTYLDLARALQLSPQGGKNYKEFARSRESLQHMLDGKVVFDDKSKRWVFKRGNQKFPIGVTSEGTKKIAILDTLLGNRYLDLQSVVFIDEPEAALHPSAISQLLDIIASLAKRGIQFFLASHSYFVVKKLYLIAAQQDLSIPVLSATDGGWTQTDLKEGLTSNPILDESIRLYEQEVDMALQ